QLAARLDDRFGVLKLGRRTAPPRHRTLRAALDWSHELLPDTQRCLLRRLAVFPAGFTLDAARAVMEDTDAAGSPVVDGVSDLIARSFGGPDGSPSEGRWRLLETIRAYALDELAAHGEADLAGRCRATYLRDLVASPGGARARLTNQDLARRVREL